MGLPAGYQRLAYLIGNNSAYSIISGLHLTDADEVRAEVYITGNCNVYGCYTGSSAGDNFSLYVGSTYYARMDGKVVSNVSSTKNARLALVHNKEGMWINGTKRITFTDVGEFTASTDFYVGALANGSSAKVIGRIYRLEVVGKFVGIPAMRVSDGVCGIYDTLNGTFYASNGTAWAGVLADETERSLLARRRLMMQEYIPGLIILPPGYTRHDWLEANNAYINTLYNFPNGYTFKARIMLVTPGSTYKLLFGSEAASGNLVSRQLVGWGPYYKNLYIGCGNFTQIASSFEYGRYYDYVGVIKNGESYISLDGQVVATYSGQFTLAQFNNCYLFCDNVRGTANFFSNVRVSGVIKIYDSAGVLTRHFVPCTDPNGVAGYYDAVTDAFFPKTGGSGTISVGFD